MLYDRMLPDTTTMPMLRPDDVADAEQRRREVGAHVAEVLADEAARQRAVGDEAQAAGRDQLADARRPAPRRRRILMPCAGFSPARSTSAAALPSGKDIC